MARLLPSAKYLIISRYYTPGEATGIPTSSFFAFSPSSTLDLAFSISVLNLSFSSHGVPEERACASAKLANDPRGESPSGEEGLDILSGKSVSALVLAFDSEGRSGVEVKGWGEEGWEKDLRGGDVLNKDV